MSNYPTLKVIISYPLLGGIAGSLPVLPYLLLADLFDGNGIKVFIYIILLAYFVVLGFIPALLTGIVLAYFKVKILTKMDYFKAFWVGFGITFLIFFWHTSVFTYKFTH